jgi:hypothetical protein
MMILTPVPYNQMVIDLDNRTIVLLLSGEKMGMYHVAGTLGIVWEQVLNDYLDKKMGKQ